MKQRKELTEVVVSKYGLDSSKDGKSAVADPEKLMLQLEAAWRKKGASDVRELCIPIGGGRQQVGGQPQHGYVGDEMFCFGSEEGISHGVSASNYAGGNISIAYVQV